MIMMIGIQSAQHWHNMRIAYFGTPDFAIPGLATLWDQGHEIAAVYTQPPRPAGRGQKPRPSAVEEFGRRHEIPVQTPTNLHESVVQDGLRSLDIAVAVVAAYGLILPSTILDIPTFGCLNIHASLLPRWRGAAPIARAILAGDDKTGVTIMQMEDGLDSGPIRLAQAISLDGRETAASLHDRLAKLGGRLIGDVVLGLESGRFPPQLQPDSGVTYAHKLDKAEGHLDWSGSAVDLERRIRAFSPRPGAWCRVASTQETIKILEAVVIAQTTDNAPGTVVDDRLTVACGEGCLRVSRAQRPGKRPLASADLLRGWSLAAGTCLE